MNTTPKKRKSKKFYFLVFLFGLLGVLVYLHTFHTTKTKALHPKPPEQVAPSTSQLTDMSNQINGIISQNSDIDVSVSVINLRTSAQQQFGITDPFEAASTSKLITAADYLHHVENGDNSLSDSIDGSSAQDEIQQMIVNSDDNAWLALNDTLGHPDLLSYATSIGLTNYDPDGNTLPSQDIAILLQKLYNGNLLDQNYRDLLLGYMAQANYTQYMGAVMPKDVKFYHKAGVLDDRIHDAAIIDNGKIPIVLVVLTKNELDDYNPADSQPQIIQSITKSVMNTYGIK